MHADETVRTPRPRGWSPKEVLQVYPVWSMPPNPLVILRFFYDIFWPLTAILLVISLGSYFLTSPSDIEAREFSWKWIALVLFRNAALTTLVAGGLHYYYYIRKKAGDKFKYNIRWPAKSSHFAFGSQNADNLFWTFAFSVPIWTAYECVSYWLYANGYLHNIIFRESPVWYLFLLAVPFIILELHFYFVHRILHARLIYKYVHSVHHRNVNPGPWSGLAMHPLEGLVYFSVVMLIWLVPSSPVHAMVMLMVTGLSAAPGHLGFGAEGKNGEGQAGHDYFHYLHHKLIECNYGSLLLPFDKWFGTMHDGTAESEEKMNKRMMERLG